MKQFISAFFLALALTGFKPTSASIVYTNINDTTIEVNAIPGSTKYYNLDLNNDGTADFKISVKCFESWQGYHPPHTAIKTSISRMNGGQIAAGPFFNNDTISSALDYWNQIDIYGNIPGLGIIGRWANRVKQESRDMYLALKNTIMAMFITDGSN